MQPVIALNSVVLPAPFGPLRLVTRSGSSARFALRTAVTPPSISGPRFMTLLTGYAATSTEAFTVSGASPVKVAIVSGNAAITWNATTKRLDIAAGLPAGEYAVVLRATNAAPSYATFTFTLTVEPPVYYIDIPASFVGGKVDASPRYLAEAGQTVTLTATPDKGYVLESLTVFDASGKAIPLTCTGPTCTFTMPAGHITVVAVFKATVANDPVVPNVPVAYVANSTLYLSGLQAGETFSVYNITGALIYQGVADVGANLCVCPLPSRGIYIIRSGNAVLKVAN
jgi:hypothetical protein